jgi:hypothetical protein
MWRVSRTLNATKVINLHDLRRIILVGIVRERLFGQDTIEEAMKVVDQVSRVTVGSTSNAKVLVGINDQEFNLIDKSVNSRNKLRGRFMSPLVVLCRKSSIPVESVARRLAATSSRLSKACLRQPFQFYKTLAILATRRLNLVRTPSAKPYLMSKVPAIAGAYIDEGAKCIAFKIALEVTREGAQDTVAVVPMEFFADVSSEVEALPAVIHRSEVFEQSIRKLESDDVGYWIPVFLLYIFLPLYGLTVAINKLASVELGELRNYETEGIALGTWVRDKRRD